MVVSVCLSYAGGAGFPCCLRDYYGGTDMTNSPIGKVGRGLALATALVAGVAFTAAPRPAHALSTGAAVGIGLGAFALGSALGAAPYYGYPYGYYPPAYPAYPYAPAYYPYPW